MSSKNPKGGIQLKVVFNDCSVIYQVSSNVTGAALLEKACNRLGTYEQWWFGLYAVDHKGISFWITLDKKISHQNIKPEGEFLKLTFAVKFYPIDFKSEVIQDPSKKVFYNHLRDMLLSEDLYCDAATCVSLAALHLQAFRGDLSGTPGANDVINKDFSTLIPKGIEGRHNMSAHEWVDVISKMWKTHSLLMYHEAMHEALKIIQELDMYGIRYYEIKNRKKTTLLLGVEAGGMNIYKTDNRMIPRVSLAWNEIKSISYIDKKFVIKCVDKNAPEFTMYSQYTKENNIIMHICVGNHELYMLRRRPTDPEDIRLLKEKARTAQKIIDEEYKKDMAMREKKFQIEESIIEMASAPKEDVEKLTSVMNKAYDETVAELDEKVRQLELNADKAMKEAGMSKEEVERLQREKEQYSNMAEKERLEKEKLAVAENESRIKASEAADEAEKVRKELEELKRKYEEDQKRLKALQDAPPLTKTATKEKKDYKTIRKERNQVATAQVAQVNNLLANKISQQSENDKLHVDIMKSGNNKFKTLRSIRGGNTRARIDEFEAM